MSVPDSFDQSYNCTFCKAIKLEKWQPDIKDLGQRKNLNAINMTTNADIESIIIMNNLLWGRIA